MKEDNAQAKDWDKAELLGVEEFTGLVQYMNPGASCAHMDVGEDRFRPGNDLYLSQMT